MSPSSAKDHRISVEIEGQGPHLFGPDDYRGWIESEIRSSGS